MYKLPTSVEIDGCTYEIRSDFRAILDICAVISDEELNDQEKSEALLDIFYIRFAEMPMEHYSEAVQQCFWFLNCGAENEQKQGPDLMNWEQDFPYIVSPVNRVIGTEIRALDYLHWWSFVAAYQEIGECLFSQIVRIRDHLARGKALDKSDREWYRKNRKLVDLKKNYSKQETDVLDLWTGKKKAAP